jgi:cytochrome c-type biogenesis protein
MPGGDPAVPVKPKDGDMGGMEVTIGLAFLAGLASFLAPCVLPLVPAYLGYLSGHTVVGTKSEDEAAPNKGHIVAHAAFFVLGFTLIFVLLGTAVGAVGRFIRGDWLRYAGGTLVILFGLGLAGMLHLPFLEQEARLQVRRKPKLGLLSSLLAGLAFGAGWTPCVGPALSSILILSADQETALRGTALLIAYSAGIGLPFILAGLLMENLRDLIRRIRPYQPLIQKIAGVVVIAVGMLLITDGFAAIGLWLEQRGIGWDLGI